jgi:Mrp family chromosome partitioning ATPase/capsular polysaccharide biosynthesis protein
LTDPAQTNPDIHIIEQLLAIGRRRWKPVLLLVVLGGLAGLLYGESQPPQFATSATILVRSGFAADPVRPGIETSTPEEEGQFLSQMEYVKSASVAGQVADKLNLMQDPAFARPDLAGIKRLIMLGEQLAHMKTGLVKAEPAPPVLDRDQVIGRLMANVKPLRSGRTYVAAISYTHSDPAVAQKVAQAFAEAFRETIARSTDAANAKVQATVQVELAKAAPETRAALEQKYHDTVIARALPGVDVVVISDARKPGAPIAPRKPFLIAVGIILGAALGCLFAGWREMRDRGIRDGDLLARQLRTRFFGYVPSISVDRKQGTVNAGNVALPDSARLAVTDPYSRFGEVVRAAAVAASAGRRGPVIAVVSTLIGEGKTVFAANLATHLGNHGRKVLLIDADFRHPELSTWLAPGAEHGVLDTLLQNKPLTETGFYDSRSNVTFLPAALNGRGVEPAGLLAGAQMEALIAAQRGEHDAIILDLPALTTAADASAIAPLVDAFILLAEWGTPSSGLIQTVLASEPEVASRLAGVAVTKTNLSKLPLYVSATSRGAYRKRIA